MKKLLAVVASISALPAFSAPPTLDTLPVGISPGEFGGEGEAVLALMESCVAI